MFNSLLAFGRNIGPAWSFRVYHFLWAFFGHLLYGFPSEKLIVVGVTGTKGKTTTSAALAYILERAGLKVALSSTAFFKIGEHSEPNSYKVSMPGRFVIPRFLSRAVHAGSQVAIMESTSEGVLQYRHRFINYDFFVFTNLRPEHIERHGSFEKYKQAKLELIRLLARSKQKKVGAQYVVPLRDARINKKGVAVNLDDGHAEDFLEAAGDAQKVGVTFKEQSTVNSQQGMQNYRCRWEGGKIQYRDTSYELRVPGEFNARNVALAAAAATLFGVPFGASLEYAKDFQGVPGRFEIIQKGNVTAVVDYAHEPFSLEEALKLAREKFSGRLVHVFGATGGGRDVWKRPRMGEISERYADRIILTNDDPYDEDQMGIVDQIRSGIHDHGKVEVVLDRAQAIRRAIELVETSRWDVSTEGRDTGVVLVTGKGSENLMCFEHGRKIPWSDRGVVEEAFGKMNE